VGGSVAEHQPGRQQTTRDGDPNARRERARQLSLLNGAVGETAVIYSARSGLGPRFPAPETLANQRLSEAGACQRSHLWRSRLIRTPRVLGTCAAGPIASRLSWAGLSIRIGRVGYNRAANGPLGRSWQCPTHHGRKRWDAAMPNNTIILRHKAFWLFYAGADDEPLDDDVVRHFDTTTINRREYLEAVIPLPCGADFSLEVTISPDLGSVNLGLRNANTNAVAEMGWWDDARWHPHALRWSELTRLHQYWVSRLAPAIHPSAAFLLLARFVGNGLDERDHFSQRKDVIRDHYEELQLFTLAETTKLADKTFVLPSEDDYRWTEDDEFGWVFGGEYPCYSIRNREHSGGSEGLFPFSDWSTVFDQLPPPIRGT